MKELALEQPSFRLATHGLRRTVETLPSQVENARFIRIPRPDYFYKSLGLNPLYIDSSLNDAMRSSYYLDGSVNPDYLAHAKVATEYVRDNLEEALQSDELFQAFLGQYSRMSSYEIQNNGSHPPISTELNSKTSRKVRTFLSINRYLQAWTEGFKEGSLISIDKEPSPITETQPRTNDGVFEYIYMGFPELLPRLQKVRGLVSDTLKTKDLKTAINTLYTMVRSWLWDQGNHSRTMIFFNVLLEKIGIQPISHGVIDYAAFIMENFEDFNRYVMYVMRDVEGLKV